eukprot:COSAG06_NODE_19239_length_847_cov_1.295455_2_plen_87_part_00
MPSLVRGSGVAWMQQQQQQQQAAAAAAGKFYGARRKPRTYASIDVANRYFIYSTKYGRIYVICCHILDLVIHSTKEEPPGYEEEPL